MRVEPRPVPTEAPDEPVAPRPDESLPTVGSRLEPTIDAAPPVAPPVVPPSAPTPVDLPDAPLPVLRRPGLGAPISKLPDADIVRATRRATAEPHAGSACGAPSGGTARDQTYRFGPSSRAKPSEPGTVPVVPPSLEQPPRPADAAVSGGSRSFRRPSRLASRSRAGAGAARRGHGDPPERRAGADGERPGRPGRPRRARPGATRPADRAVARAGRDPGRPRASSRTARRRRRSGARPVARSVQREAAATPGPRPAPTTAAPPPPVVARDLPIAPRADPALEPRPVVAIPERPLVGRRPLASGPDRAGGRRDSTVGAVGPVDPARQATRSSSRAERADRRRRCRFSGPPPPRPRQARPLCRCDPWHQRHPMPTGPSAVSTERAPSPPPSPSLHRTTVVPASAIPSNGTSRPPRARAACRVDSRAPDQHAPEQATAAEPGRRRRPGSRAPARADHRLGPRRAARQPRAHRPPHRPPLTRKEPWHSPPIRSPVSAST